MFYVYWLGTCNGEWVEAASIKDAKWIFALKHGVNSISYVKASKNGPLAC